VVRPVRIASPKKMISSLASGRRTGGRLNQCTPQPAFTVDLLTVSSQKKHMAQSSGEKSLATESLNRRAKLRFS
jgi:hypothetical protein